MRERESVDVWEATDVRWIVLLGVWLGVILIATTTAAGLMAGDTALSVHSEDSTLTVGNTTAVTVLASPVNDGVGSWDITVTVNDTPTAELTDITGVANAAFSDTEVGEDGSFASMDAFGADEAPTDELRILQVTVQGISTGQAEIAIESSASLGDTNGISYTITGMDTATLTVGNSNTESATENDVTTANDDAPRTLTDNNPRFYIGQTVERAAGVDADEELDLVAPDGSSQPVFANSAGVVTIDTAGLEAGQYSLLSEDGGLLVEFRLIEQTISTFEFDASAVRNHGSDTEATLSVETNRRPTVHYFTMTLDGTLVEASTIQKLFEQGDLLDINGDGSADALRVVGSNSDAFALDFSELGTGEAVLSTTIPDTSVTASASITVQSGGSGRASLPTKTLTAPRQSVVEIPVSLSNTDQATLEIGSQALNYHVTMEVQDGNDDGAITLRWDTAAAGTTATEEAAWSTESNNDAVQNVQRATPQVTSALQAEVYPVSLQVGDTETDVGQVVLEEAQHSLCGRNAASLIELYNENVDGIPGFASGIVTDETVHLLVDGDSQEDFTVVTGTDTRVEEFSVGPPEEATIEVSTDCGTVTAINDARDPQGVFADHYRAGEITISGTSFFKSVVLGLVEFGVKIGEFLGLF